MNEDTMLAVMFIAIAVAVCSFFGVAAWVDAQRKEREAYYRNDAIKKVAEMQGTIPESVLELLRKALEPRPEPVSWAAASIPAVQIAKYRNEMVEKLAEGGGSEAALTYLREQDRAAEQRRRDGQRLAGLILVAVGGLLTAFLNGIVKEQPVYLAGLIPLAVGVILLFDSLSTRKRLS